MAVSYSMFRKKPGWRGPRFCTCDAQKGCAVCELSPGHLCWCVPFTAQPGVWHLPSLKSLKPCCHMLIVLYCSGSLVDVISYHVARIESNKVKNFLLKWGHLKPEEYFSPPVTVFPCHAKNSP